MSPELAVGVLAVSGVVLVGYWRLFRWFVGGKPGPNPWDEKTEESLHQPDAMPLCRRCLEPHESYARYCSNCGLPVDSMVPLSPFHQIFAIGDILLTGTQRKFPVNWLTITGYVLLSMAQYLFFAPFYWFFLLRNVHRLRADASAGHKTNADASGQINGGTSSTSP
jgi:hypothetical protein